MLWSELLIPRKLFGGRDDIIGVEEILEEGLLRSRCCGGADDDGVLLTGLIVVIVVDPVFDGGIDLSGRGVLISKIVISLDIFLIDIFTSSDKDEVEESGGASPPPEELSPFTPPPPPLPPTVGLLVFEDMVMLESSFQSHL